MLGRRKSSDDLNREAKLRGMRVYRPTDTTRVFVPDPEVVLLQLEHDLIQREIDRAQGGHTKPKYACAKHEWNPVLRSANQPLPPRGVSGRECPQCLEENDKSERKPAASEVLAHDGASDFLRRDEDWETNWRLAKPNEPVPGSVEEARVLEEMDAKRDRELRRERMRVERLRRFQKVEELSDYDALWAR